MIIFRYLAGEVFRTFAVINFILLLIFLSNQFAHYLIMTAAGKLLGLQLLHLMIFMVPQLLSLIFPLALYLSILLTYSRLYADREMAVLTACGVSQIYLLRLTMFFTLAAAVPVLIFTLWANPLIAAARNQLLAQINASSMLQSLAPGRFQQTSNGQRIFYIESMSPNRQQLQNVFVAEQSSKNKNAWTVMTAQSGYHYIDPLTKDRFLIAESGYRYEGAPGDKNFTLSHFGEYGIRIDIPGLVMRDSEMDSTSTWRLWHMMRQHRLDAAAELQWRIAIPLCMFVLTLLAFALSHAAPRQGRFTKLFPALLLYIIYANFLIVGQSWISGGSLSPVIGLWPIHLCLLFLGLGLLAQRSGYWRSTFLEKLIR